MNQTDWKNLEELVTLTDNEIETYLTSVSLEEVRKALQAASKTLPKGYSLNFKMELSVFDADREQELPLIQTGLCSDVGQEPYVYSADSTDHRYLVNGEIRVVPHDYCPHCWGIWDFKFKNEACPECEFTLGKEVKMLLDENICPYCEQGEVRIENPVCTNCKHEVDKKKVAWG
jgi:hypothetical protein